MSLRSTGVSASAGISAWPVTQSKMSLSPAAQQALVLIELGGTELGDMGARELAKENVVLLVATVDAAIEQTLTPRLEIRLARHVFPR